MTLAILMALAVSLTSCGKSGDKAAGKDEHGEKGHKEEEKELTLTTEEATRAGVKVEALNAQKLATTIVVTATIQADQDRIARVSPRTEGRITSAPARLGDRVGAGQVLASLDSVGVGEAHAALLQAQSELRIAEADFKRAEALVADEIIPRKDFLRAQSDREKAASSVRAATDRLRLLGGNPAASGRGISGFAVSAPFAGTIIEKKATLGDLASPSQPLFTIADLSRVWIVADLPEAALSQVRIGANAKISVPSYPNDVFAGRVSHIGAVLNKETRTVAARIEVGNSDGRLKPDMFATATIEVAGDTRELMTLPDPAIVLMDGQPTVFVYEQGAYVARAIQPGERMGGRTVVTGGIKPGEQVVTAGAYELKARKQKSQLGHGH
ncbi:efflux RND transporter periplasmic adaptor subunit [Caenimonas sedimenti]|uniref:efflux RND transporter periplasmic adaptor subunit n=1 Tax=Caenimonas sedimenti TaxID=2596921 RepID=UPI001C94ADE1|nr:efflux RND transporter periplasmic adaptor subunit [Caenimonas sedimenti]